MYILCALLFYLGMLAEAHLNGRLDVERDNNNNWVMYVNQGWVDHRFIC